MGNGSSKELTPEERELKEAAEHRAIEKSIESNNLGGMYYPLLYGSDANRRNDKNECLLELAVRLQRVECTAFLLLFKAERESATSSGGTVKELARQMKEEAGEDSAKLLHADAICDLMEKPGTERLFRAAYDMYLDKEQKKEQMLKQRRFGIYFISIVVVLHLIAFFFEDSDTSELMQLSPFLKIMRVAHYYIKAYMHKVLGVFYGAGKDEL